MINKPGLLQNTIIVNIPTSIIYIYTARQKCENAYISFEKTKLSTSDRVQKNSF